jgi:hypothetical protein
MRATYSSSLSEMQDAAAAQSLPEMLTFADADFPRVTRAAHH